MSETEQSRTGQVEGDRIRTRPPRGGPGTGRPRPLVGPLLVGIGVVHLAFTPVFQPAFAELLQARLLGGGEAVTLTRQALQEAGFWYVVTGVAALQLGGLAWWVERRGLRVPVAFGVSLALLSCCGLLLGPVTGFWLFLLPAAAALVRAAQGRKVSPVSRS